jgi:hypothetical protein
MDTHLLMTTGRAEHRHEAVGQPVEDEAMTRTLDDLHEISRNIRARVNDRTAENPRHIRAEADELHWPMVLREELELADEEAALSKHVAPETYRSGYDQGWADAIRVILDARNLLDS